jgi:hypothetical protein
MFRLALTVLLTTALSIEAVHATEFSPWFGSAETVGFQMELMPADPATPPEMSAIVPTGNCRDVCPNPPKFAIVEDQDLAKAP